MKITNGKIILFTGTMHALFAVLPLAFGKQFLIFSKSFFFKINSGLAEFPLLHGTMNYEKSAAFWFFYFGLLFIPMGYLLDYLESKNFKIPRSFVWSYLIITLIGVYMIPFSGMTLFMLHMLYIWFIPI
jgi:hypothetical protein